MATQPIAIRYGVVKMGLTLIIGFWGNLPLRDGRYQEYSTQRRQNMCLDILPLSK